MKVLVDTNLLTKWANPADARYGMAVDALRILRNNGHVPVLVPQNLYEFWVVATRPIAVNGLGFSTEEASIELDRFSDPLFQLLLDERAVFSHWRQLVETYRVQGKPAHDARLVAAMLRHGLSHLLTFNVTDFTRYKEITVVDPSDVIAGTALVSLDR